MRRYRHSLAGMLAALVLTAAVAVGWTGQAQAASDNQSGVIVTFLATDRVPVGDDVALVLRINNAPSFQLGNIQVELALNGTPLDPTGVTFDPPLPDLIQMNDSWEGTLHYTVQPADLPGPLTFTAKVRATIDPTGEFTQNIEFDTLAETVSLPAVRLLKTVDGGETAEIELGDSVAYTFTVENIGSVELRNVVISDPDVLSADLPVGDLTPGIRRTLPAVTYTPVAGDFNADGEFVNVATVTAHYIIDEFNNTDIVVDTDSATVVLMETPTTSTTPTVDLDVDKTVSSQTPAAGQEVTFTITVTDLDDDEETVPEDVVIQDVLPDGLTYVRHTASQGTYDPTTGRWSVGDLANEPIATLTITSAVAEPFCDRITNTARLINVSPSDRNAANNTASAAVSPAEPCPVEEELPEEPEPESENVPIAETFDEPAPPLPNTGGNPALLIGAGVLSLLAGLSLCKRRV